MLQRLGVAQCKEKWHHPRSSGRLLCLCDNTETRFCSSNWKSYHCFCFGRRNMATALLAVAMLLTLSFHWNGHIPWPVIKEREKKDFLAWLFFRPELDACFGPHISLQQERCHGRRSVLWHPQLTPRRHTAGAGAWWYMCPGEIVKSIWMGSGPPWGGLELACYSDWSIPFIFTDRGVQCFACGPWGELRSSYKGSNSTQAVASDCPSCLSRVKWEAVKVSRT